MLRSQLLLPLAIALAIGGLHLAAAAEPADETRAAEARAAEAPEPNPLLGVWEGVSMIADVPTSSVGLAVQEVARATNKLVINVGSATSDLTGKSCAPTGLHWVYNTVSLANGTGSAVVKAGGDTWFFITADYAFGHALERDASTVITAHSAGKPTPISPAARARPASDKGLPAPVNAAIAPAPQNDSSVNEASVRVCGRQARRRVNIYVLRARLGRIIPMSSG